MGKRRCGSSVGELTQGARESLSLACEQGGLVAGHWAQVPAKQKVKVLADEVQGGGICLKCDSQGNSKLQQAQGCWKLRGRIRREAQGCLEAQDMSIAFLF